MGRRYNWQGDRGHHRNRRRATARGDVNVHRILLWIAVIAIGSAGAAVTGLETATQYTGNVGAKQLVDRSQERYFSRCDEARAAGVAPIYSGSPGYREALDGDGDGVACEPYYRRW